MVISQTKTKCIFVVGKRLRKRLDNFNSNLNIKFSLDGAVIDQVKRHKPLGIHLDQDLDFDIPTEVLCISLSKKIGFLKYISPFLKRSHKLLYYDGHLKPSLLYDSSVWSSTRRETWTAFSDFKRGQQE